MKRVFKKELMNILSKTPVFSMIFLKIMKYNVNLSPTRHQGEKKSLKIAKKSSFLI